MKSHVRHIGDRLSCDAPRADAQLNDVQRKAEHETDTDSDDVDFVTARCSCLASAKALVIHHVLVFGEPNEA